MIKRPIINLAWFVSERCNLHCLHCSVAESDAQCYQGELNLQDMKKALRNVAEWGIFHIHFLGGEPTFRRDFLDILGICKSFGIETSFNTNGQLIDFDYARHIVEARVEAVTFSFEGPDAETNDQIRGKGTFEKTIKAIEYLKRAREDQGTLKPPKISLEIGVNKLWLDRINDMRSFILSVKPETVYLEATQAEGRALLNKEIIVVPKEFLLEIMPDLCRLVSQTPDVPFHFKFFPKWVEYGNIMSGSKAGSSDHLCIALTPQCYITGNGKIIPCTYSVKRLGWDGVPDVFSPLATVLNSPHFQTFIKLWKEGARRIPDTCRFCGYRHFFCEVCPIAPFEEREAGTSLCREAMKRITVIKPG